MSLRLQNSAGAWRHVFIGLGALVLLGLMNWLGYDPALVAIGFLNTTITTAYVYVFRYEYEHHTQGAANIFALLLLTVSCLAQTEVAWLADTLHHFRPLAPPLVANLAILTNIAFTLERFARSVYWEK